MFSRLLLSTGRSIIGKETPLCLRVICAQRNSSTAVAPTSSTSVTVPNAYPAQLKDWENFKMPGAPYEGMGPTPPMEEFDRSLVRHYVLPEYFFEFLYPRTGATGLYTLMAGVGTMLLSKEFYIYTHETIYTIALVACLYIITSKAGASISAGYESERQRFFHALDAVKGDELSHLQSMVDNIKLEQWRAGVQEFINDAKKVNLSMMLETEYMNRQASVVEAVKRSLDYQVAVQKVDTELSHGHMVDWIEKKVMATITPASQKTTLAACINQLNAIASKK